MKTTFRVLKNMAGLSHDGPANRLAQEKSPYLLQHAHNPVDWYPWGDEAFKIAKETNRPVFLSVGYSTCHWCHVMERESFIDSNIAKIMNQNFVNIKVDREERPDVDQIYMNFITATSGHGGWPMSVFLTPNGEPMMGGTYFPPEDRWGSPGFKSILRTISEQWKNNKTELLSRGQSIASVLQREMKPKIGGQAPNPKIMLQKAYNHFVETFDNQFGGFGQGTKFPNPVDLDFLMYYYRQNSSQSSGHSALKMLDETLTAIDNGGIHDHLGKGFHRYSVDRKWRIPHYEKMLYDQGQLLAVYSNFYKETSKFENVVHDIVEYVKKDLTHKLGGFFSAEDAESYPTHDAEKKGEGAFYVWTYDDLKKSLTPEQFKAFSIYYGIEKNGNCPPGSDPHGELTGQNTFYIGNTSIEKIAKEMKTSEENVLKLIDEAKKVLLPIRDKRPRPSLDSKIITAWNGLMISGLTAAYGAFPEKKEYLEMAQNAVKFLKKYLIDQEGRLLRTAYSDEKGENVIQIPKPILAFAVDYAFLIQALLDLYEIDFNESHLQWAKELQNEMNELFFDKETNAGYFNSRQDPTVFARMQEDQDGAEPCANSIATKNLLRLSDIFGDENFKKMAQNIFNGHAHQLEQYPYALPKMVLASNRMEKSAMQIVVVSPTKNDEVVHKMLQAISSRYIPDKCVFFLSADDTKEHEFLLSNNPQLQKQLEVGKESAAVFICENFTCSTPIRNLDELEKRITAKPQTK